MLGLKRHPRACVPVGRPLVDASGLPTGPDPEGIDGLDADCPICAYPIAGPKDGDNSRTIRFGAIIMGPYLDDVPDPIYRNVVEMLGPTEEAAIRRFKYHLRRAIANHFELELPPLTQAGVFSNSGVVDIAEVYTHDVKETSSGTVTPSETFVLVEIFIENNPTRATQIKNALEEAHALTSDQVSIDGSGTRGPSSAYASTVFGRDARIEANAVEVYDEHPENRVIQQLESCGHQFHRECIATYAQTPRNANKHKMCPSCNVPMLAEEHTYLTITNFSLPKKINWLLQSANRMRRQRDAASQRISTPANRALVTSLESQINELEDTIYYFQDALRSDHKKTPGTYPVSSWSQLSQTHHGSDNPPQRQVLLSDEQQRDIINWAMSRFVELQGQIAAAFPQTSDGRYPLSNPSYSTPAGLLIARDLDAGVMLGQAQAEAVRLWGQGTTLSTGIKTRLTNDWNKRRVQILKTATKLRNSEDSLEKTRLVNQLNGLYLKKLRERELQIPLPVETDLSLYDEIARSSQIEVLGPGLAFCDYVHLNTEIELVKKTHIALYTWARSEIQNHHAAQISIALRTHPLGDCGRDLLNQVMRVLMARDDYDFRRRYKRDKVYTEEAVYSIIKANIDQMPASSTAAPCDEYKQRSALEMMVDEETPMSTEERDANINTWLDLVQPDIVRMLKTSPWAKYWSTDEALAAVVHAYRLKGERGTPRYVSPETFRPVFEALKARLATLRSQNVF